MRKIGIALGIVVLIAVVAAVIFAATFDVNKYRETIQSELQKQLGRPVNLGNMQLRLFPPRFGVQDLAIADDPRFSPDAPFVKAKELDVSVQLLPLLHKQIQIVSLDLHQPTVNLIKNHTGEWNFASVGHPSARRNPAQEQQFSLGELTIKDGQISLLDQIQSKTPSLYDHIDVTVKGFSLTSPFTIDFAAHMAGAGTQELRLQGEVGPLAEA